MESLSPSTIINVLFSAVRKMVAEARRAGMIGQEETANLTDTSIRQKGTRLGDWLTREQAGRYGRWSNDAPRK
jgi:hypothetical protein